MTVCYLYGMATHHKLPVPRTAHIYTLGEVGKHIKKVWIVTHGYGQLASSFIHRFEPILDEETLIIAPEGLSRFYWGKFTGKVVSSWMTSGDRLDEIADFSNYMQSVYELFIPQLAEDVNITLMGFSQGCATQIRWILREFPSFNNLVMWSGSIPEDIEYHERKDYWASKNLYFSYGTEDQLLSEKRIKWVFEVIKEKALTFDIFTFAGKHEVDKQALKVFCEQYKL